MVTEIRPGGTVHWVTASSAPCLSIFKPVVLGAALPPLGPVPADQFDPQTRWWRHEARHRRQLRGDIPAALAHIAAERDALEARFQARIDAALIDGGLDAAVAACWAEADAAEARWTADPEVPGPPEPGADQLRRSWGRLNAVAGLQMR
jgi:hypothetical protein